MKQTIKNYLIIIFTLLLFTFFASLILTILEKNQIMSSNAAIITTNIISYFFIAIFSFILGIKLKKRAILHGLFFAIIITLLSLIIGNDLTNIDYLIKMITKTIIILFFTILGVNKKEP